MQLMNGSESKLNRVSPTASVSKIKNDPSPPPAYRSKENTIATTPAPYIPVGNWAMDTWQPPLPSAKCPLPPIGKSMPVCDTSETSGRMSVCDTSNAFGTSGKR